MTKFEMKQSHDNLKREVKESHHPGLSTNCSSFLNGASTILGSCRHSKKSKFSRKKKRANTKKKTFVKQIN